MWQGTNQSPQAADPKGPSPRPRAATSQPQVRARHRWRLRLCRCVLMFPRALPPRRLRSSVVRRSNVTCLALQRIVRLLVQSLFSSDASHRSKCASMSHEATRSFVGSDVRGPAAPCKGESFPSGVGFEAELPRPPPGDPPPLGSPGALPIGKPAVPIQVT